MSELDCLILTTGHDVEDARLHRHRAALVAVGLRCETRAVKLRRRMRPLAAPVVAFRALRTLRPDSVLLPDPELFVCGTLIARLLRVRAIIDVHEDYSKVALNREWIPKGLRRAVALIAGSLIRIGRRLADATIVADENLARSGDAVVRNIPGRALFPGDREGPSRDSIIYVGDVTESRGAFEMIDLVASTDGIRLEIIGHIDPVLQDQMVRHAHDAGCSTRVQMFGRLPYEEAWSRAAGAIAGLSLLHSTPAYEAAIPSKLWEYMAAGLPVIASDLRAQRHLIAEAGCGVVVAGISEASRALQEWFDDPTEAFRLGQSGRRYWQARVDRLDGSADLLAAVRGTRRRHG